MKYFTPKEVCQKLGISPNTLATWVRDGVITPSLPTKQGSRQASYSPEDYIKAGVMARMLKAGMARSLVVKVINEQGLVIHSQNEKGELVFKFILSVAIPNG